MTSTIQDRLIQRLRSAWRTLDRRPGGRVLRGWIVGGITLAVCCALRVAQWWGARKQWSREQKLRWRIRRRDLRQGWREQRLVWRIRRDGWWREQKLTWWILWRDLRQDWRECRLGIAAAGAGGNRGVGLLLGCVHLAIPACSMRVATFVLRLGRERVFRNDVRTVPAAPCKVVLLPVALPRQSERPLGPGPAFPPGPARASRPGGQERLSFGRHVPARSSRRRARVRYRTARPLWA